MRRIIVHTLSALLLSVPLYALEQTKFHPKLQMGSELSIDTLRRQNLNIVRKAVEGIRENLPQKVDAYTKIIAIDGNGTKLIYTFEVQSGLQSDETMHKKGEKMIPRIAKGICMSSKRFLKAGISIRYRYISKTSKNEILVVDMNDSLCDALLHSQVY